MRAALALVQALADEIAPPPMIVGHRDLVVVRYKDAIPDGRYPPGHRLLVVVAPKAHAKAIEEALVEVAQENGGFQVWHERGE